MHGDGEGPPEAGPGQPPSLDEADGLKAWIERARAVHELHKSAYTLAHADYWQERAQVESLAGRWGTPENVARAARFLASPAAEFITGQIINVNGGFRYGYQA